MPYITKWHAEARIYAKDFNKLRKHIAPHTLEMAAIVTRLTEHNLTNIQKLKLYDGSPCRVHRRQREGAGVPREGLKGSAPLRARQISNALVRDPDSACKPFMVLNELER